MDSNLIISRLKEFYNLHSDKDFCDYFGISASTMSNWRRRNNIDLERILPKCVDVDYNWLLNENEEMPKKSPKNEGEMLAFYKAEYEKKCAELKAANARLDKLINKLTETQDRTSNVRY